MTAAIGPIHGVLLRIEQLGILLTGQPGIGKSQAALELIQRGHALIADDAPLFHADRSRLIGSCPPALRNFLEIRGLGILNIRALYGDSAVTDTQALDLIIELVPATPLAERILAPPRAQRHWDTVSVPHITLAVSPGRQLAPLIEVLARHEKLLQHGYDAAVDFCERHQQLMEPSTS